MKECTQDHVHARVVTIGHHLENFDEVSDSTIAVDEVLNLLELLLLSYQT